MIGVEGKGLGVGEQVIVNLFGQYGQQIVLLHLGGGYFPGGWL